MNIYFKDILSGLNLFRKGKVRDVYEFDDSLLIVASDRISAFDVIMDEPIPNKGNLLTEISTFWFSKTSHIVPNHYLTSNVDEYPNECLQYKEILNGRSMLVKKCTPLPVEFVVRGYVAGSGWKEYQESETICGIKLPSGLLEYSKLPEPIFTPATKAEEGHDENIDFERASSILGSSVAEKLRNVSIELYKFGAQYLSERNLILADTKFEFGTLPNGDIILIDEALTPDSSRFWLKEYYAPGKVQINFDKQVLRDWLETTDWDKNPPAPPIPNNIIESILSKYKEAINRIKN